MSEEIAHRLQDEEGRADDLASDGEAAASTPDSGHVTELADQVRASMATHRGAGRDPWKAISGHVIATLWVPVLDAAFSRFVSPTGEETIVSKVGGLPQLDDDNLRNVVFRAIKQDVGDLPPARIVKQALYIWRHETRTLTASIAVSVDSEEERFASTWSMTFVEAPGAPMDAGDVQALLKSQCGLTDHEIGRWKAWAERTHRVTYKRTANDRTYVGLGLAARSDDGMTGVTGVTETQAEAAAGPAYGPDSGVDDAPVAAPTVGAITVRVPRAAYARSERPKTPFGYPGGKSKIAKLLLEELAAEGSGAKEYREPFVGGGSVLMAALGSGQFSRVWANDADPGIAAIWSCAFERPELLKHAVSMHTPSASEFRRLKDALRAGIMDPVELAVAKLAIHQTSYAALGEMASGPTGGRNEPRWLPKNIRDQIDKIQNVAQGVTVTCTNLDFSQVLTSDDALYYLDPPYYEKGPKLYVRGFSEQDHVRLAEQLRRMKARFVLSYDDHPVVRDLYQWARIRELPLRYATPKPKECVELLITRK